MKKLLVGVGLILSLFFSFGATNKISQLTERVTTPSNTLVLLSEPVGGGFYSNFSMTVYNLMTNLVNSPMGIQYTNGFITVYSLSNLTIETIITLKSNINSGVYYGSGAGLSGVLLGPPFIVSNDLHVRSNLVVTNDVFVAGKYYGDGSSLSGIASAVGTNTFATNSKWLLNGIATNIDNAEYALLISPNPGGTGHPLVVKNLSGVQVFLVLSDGVVVCTSNLITYSGITNVAGDLRMITGNIYAYNANAFFTNAAISNGVFFGSGAGLTGTVAYVTNIIANLRATNSVQTAVPLTVGALTNTTANIFEAYNSNQTKVVDIDSRGMATFYQPMVTYGITNTSGKYYGDGSALTGITGFAVQNLVVSNLYKTNIPLTIVRLDGSNTNLFEVIGSNNVKLFTISSNGIVGFNGESNSAGGWWLFDTNKVNNIQVVSDNLLSDSKVVYLPTNSSVNRLVGTNEFPIWGLMHNGRNWGTNVVLLDSKATNSFEILGSGGGSIKLYDTLQDNYVEITPLGNFTGNYIQYPTEASGHIALTNSFNVVAGSNIIVSESLVGLTKTFTVNGTGSGGSVTFDFSTNFITTGDETTSVTVAVITASNIYSTSLRVMLSGNTNASGYWELAGMARRASDGSIKGAFSTNTIGGYGTNFAYLTNDSTSVLLYVSGDLYESNQWTVEGFSMASANPGWRPPPPVFTIDTISNLHAYWTAYSLTNTLEDGDTVSNWVTQAGAAYTLAGLPSTRSPTLDIDGINSKPAVRFTALNSQYLQTAELTNVQPSWTFIVWQQVNSGGYINDAKGGSSTRNVIRSESSGTDYHSLSGGSATMRGLPVVDGVPVVLTVHWEGDSSYCRTNGIQQSTNLVGLGTAALQGLTIGDTRTLAGSCLDGYISELIYITNALTAENITNIENILIDRYIP